MIDRDIMAALAWANERIDVLMDAEAGTPEAEELGALATFVDRLDQDGMAALTHAVNRVPSPEVRARGKMLDDHEDGKCGGALACELCLKALIGAEVQGLVQREVQAALSPGAVRQLIDAATLASEPRGFKAHAAGFEGTARALAQARGERSGQSEGETDDR
jgi:hypothetical protein|tara:strand:- start:153 stop:638 length:486 start_codon:yes stop_codon:yes gene_type:complete